MKGLIVVAVFYAAMIAVIALEVIHRPAAAGEPPTPCAWLQHRVAAFNQNKSVTMPPAQYVGELYMASLEVHGLVKSPRSKDLTLTTAMLEGAQADVRACFGF